MKASLQPQNVSNRCPNDVQEAAYKWKLLATLLPKGDGQRFFQRISTGDIYVCDNSGEVPDHTDDGPLRLLPNIPITCSVDVGSRVRFVAKVVVEWKSDEYTKAFDSEEELSTVMLAPEEAYWLVRIHGFRVVTLTSSDRAKHTLKVLRMAEEQS